MNDSLQSMSIGELEALAARASQLASDMAAERPSCALAIANGVVDKSYDTVRYGRIASYSGRAYIRQSNGVVWLAVGHGPSGNAHFVAREGYIDFKQLGPLEELDEREIAQISFATGDESLIADVLEISG